MDAATLIAKALEQREQWVDLGGGKRVRIRRPAAAEMFKFARNEVTAETFLRCAVGWEGITEAHILGAAVGSSDPAPWSVDLWLTLALDNMDWMQAVSEAIVGMVSTYMEQREAVTKN
jgi:hypothetical protein